MTPTPATQANSLFERIATLNKQSQRPDEFTLTALKREATALLKSDAFHGYMALGALAAMSWDDADLDKNHQKAIDLFDGELSRMNYAISLQLVHRGEESAIQALLATEHEPENLTALRRAITYAMLAGNLRDAMNLLQTWKSRTTERHTEYDAEDIARTLRLTGVPESEFGLGMRIMNEILRQHRFYAESTVIDIDDDPVEPSVLIQFHIQTDFTHAQAIDNEACARLCEELPDGGHSGTLMFGIVGMYPDVHHPV